MRLNYGSSRGEHSVLCRWGDIAVLRLPRFTRSVLVPVYLQTIRASLVIRSQRNDVIVLSEGARIRRSCPFVSFGLHHISLSLSFSFSLFLHVLGNPEGPLFYRSLPSPMTSETTHNALSLVEESAIYSHRSRI